MDRLPDQGDDGLCLFSAQMNLNTALKKPGMLSA